MEWRGKIALLVMGLFFLAAVWGAARAGKSQGTGGPGNSRTTAAPPELPVQPPGYFPGLIPPSNLGTSRAGFRPPGPLWQPGGLRRPVEGLAQP